MEKYYKIVILIISTILITGGCSINKDSEINKYKYRINDINEKCDEIYGKIIRIYELNLSG